VTYSIAAIPRHRFPRRPHSAVAAAALAALVLSGCAGSSVGEAGKTAAEGASGERPMLSLAERMAENARYAAAVPLYREVYLRGHADTEALAGLADALIELGRYAEAERVLGKAAGAQTRDPRIQLALGRVNLVFARPEIALEHFRRAADHGGGARADSGRAIALDALGRHQAALDAHARAVEAGKDDPNLLSNSALSLAAHDHPGEAVDILEKLVERPDAGAQHRQNLVFALVMNGEQEKARRVAAVDLDSASATKTLRYFRELASLSPKERVRALIFAGKRRQRSRADEGILVLPDDSGRRAAVMAVLQQPVPVPDPQPRAESEPAPEPEAEPEPEPEPEATAMPPLVDPEGWSVQVAAYRSPQRLVQGRETYWSRYPDILGPLEPRRSEVDFGDRDEPPRGFFYRLNAGPLKDYEEAEAICRRLKDAGADCWIRPPEPSEGRLPRDGAEQPAERAP